MVENTLNGEVALLRESNTLRRSAKSAVAQSAAAQQMVDAEHLVKTTEEMVKRSRKQAAEVARHALLDAREIQKAADALSAEAKLQLNMGGVHLKAAPKASMAQTAEDGADD